MNFDLIFENNKKWIAEKTAHNPDYFSQLSQGQQPECLYIGCSDSRVTAKRSWYKTGFPKIRGWIFDVRTGELKDLKLNVTDIFADIRSIYDLRPLDLPTQH